MQELKKITDEIVELKGKLQKNIKELSKYRITLNDVLKELEEKSDE